VPYEKIKAFKSNVVEAILNEFAITERYDVDNILGVVERFDICNDKKLEMRRTVLTLCNQLKLKFDSLLLGAALSRISGCGDSLRMCEKLISTGEDGSYAEESLKKWHETVYKDMNAYIDLDDRHRNVFLQYIIHAKRFETSAVDYSQLYKHIFELPRHS
jgi:hypothetical protein